MSYFFDAGTHADRCVNWAREYINSIDPEGIAVIGISGGKDSSVVAAIMAAALGVDRVLGVMMPNGTQVDIHDSEALVKHLGIPNIRVNISDAFTGLTDRIAEAMNINEFGQGYSTNTPARIRMATLFGIAAQLGHGFVVNTCNRSEDVVGYSTLFGDNAGTFGPIARLTTEEVIAIGNHLGLPTSLTRKMPTDGMSLNSDGTLMGDEAKLGVTYHEINKIIRTGEHSANYDKVVSLYKRSRFKLDIVRMPCYDPQLPDFFLSEYGL